MRFIIRCTLLALPALALATTQAFAQARPIGLSDSQEPGSVIIFPKFIGGARVTVDVTAANPSGIAVARTEIEVGAICPPLNLFARNLAGCPEHQPVKVRFHWVCPGSEGFDSNNCRETDFDVVLSVNGKTVFTADGLPINSNSPVVPAPKCARGYLIGWVVRTTDDAPIKFDALVGNAVIRGPNVGPESTAVSAYQAITIQANTGDAIGDVLGTANSSSPLIFTAANATGTYQAITGVQTGDVRFDKTAPGGPPPDVLSESFLTLLTLDVRSDQPNNPTSVDIDFWNESLGGAGQTIGSTNVNFERLLSTATHFVCWVQVGLTTDTTQQLGDGEVVPVPALDPNLTQVAQGTRKGVFVAGPATKFADGSAPQDGTGPVTLIAIVETEEGTAPNGFQERKYNFNAQDDSQTVDTFFCPRTSICPPGSIGGP